LPYLDHRLVELAFRLPTSLKLDRVETKVVLREAMREYLPDSVRRRRDKIGYAPPQRAWLLGPLRDAARELLTDSRTGQRPWVDARHLQASWDRFTRGEPSEEGTVVLALTLELWSRRFLDQPRTVRSA
jgi:asparagine synthase (glutamine-hydrolysing)